METTNGIYNKSLYDEISIQSALMWQRVQVMSAHGLGMIGCQFEWPVDPWWRVEI